MTESRTDEVTLKDLNEATDRFIAMLQEKFKVDESLIALLIPTTKGSELRVRVNGESYSIVNMVFAVVQQLIPADFALLLDAMHNDPAFGLQRDATPIDKRFVN